VVVALLIYWLIISATGFGNLDSVDGCFIKLVHGMSKLKVVHCLVKLDLSKVVESVLKYLEV